MASDLLPGTRRLLLELIGGLDAADPALPEIRIAGGGRSGVRCWLRGSQSRELQGRRQPAQFDELRAAGYLRYLRNGANPGELFYAFTPDAFRLRDQGSRRGQPPSQRARPDSHRRS